MFRLTTKRGYVNWVFSKVGNGAYRGQNEARNALKHGTSARIARQARSVQPWRFVFP